MSIDRLSQLIREKKNPTCVGLDARPEYIPPQLIERNIELYGRTMKAMAEALFEFNAALIDALCPIIPAIKPQSAYYELLGADGVDTLRRTVEYAKAKGLYTIIDAKRADIGPTATAYAEAYFGTVDVGDKTRAAFNCDCLTINPYLGSDGIKPFLKYCPEHAVFVLVKTSNNSSVELQDMLLGDRPMYKVVGSYVNRWGANFVGECGYSAVGAVVGATNPKVIKELRAIYPRTFFLVPGYGAQGGTAADVCCAFDREGGGAVVNSSRGIICAWQKKNAAENFAEAAYDAAAKMKRELCAYII